MYFSDMDSYYSILNSYKTSKHYVLNLVWKSYSFHVRQKTFSSPIRGISVTNSCGVKYVGASKGTCTDLLRRANLFLYFQRESMHTPSVMN